jgi:hypothetical protein
MNVVIPPAVVINVVVVMTDVLKKNVVDLLVLK